MSLSPNQAIAALERAMDEAPLTADQRRKILQEFTERLGIAANVPQQEPLPTVAMNLPLSMAPPPLMMPPLTPQPAPLLVGMNVPFSMPPSQPPPGPSLAPGLPGIPLAELNKPVSAPPSQPPPGPSLAPGLPGIPLAELNKPVSAALIDSAPPLPGILHVPEVSLSAGSNVVQWKPPGGPDPKKPATETDVDDRLRTILEEKQKERSSVTFGRGVLDAIFIGIGVGVTAGGAGLLMSQEPQLVIPYALLTMLAVVIFTLILYMLGSVHEKTWGGQRAWGIVRTLLRGVLGPVSAPLGILVCLHEAVWGKAYGVTWKGRVLRSLIGIVSVPVGAAWALSSRLTRLVGVHTQQPLPA